DVRVRKLRSSIESVLEAVRARTPSDVLEWDAAWDRLCGLVSTTSEDEIGEGAQRVARWPRWARKGVPEWGLEIDTVERPRFDRDAMEEYRTADLIVNGLRAAPHPAWKLARVLDLMRLEGVRPALVRDLALHAPLVAELRALVVLPTQIDESAVASVSA